MNFPTLSLTALIILILACYGQWREITGPADEIGKQLDEFEEYIRWR